MVSPLERVLLPTLSPAGQRTRFLQPLRDLQARRGDSLGRLFEDFLALAATATAKHFQPLVAQDEIEEQYARVAGRYEQDDLRAFAECLALLTSFLEVPPGAVDFLGPLFMMEGMGDDCKGQFFTPAAVCDAMSGMLFADVDLEDPDRELLTMSEPACGAGAVIISAINELQRRGFDWQHRLFVEATDIDSRAFHMAYLQLSLLGVPARVNHGNTLTGDVWRSWVTPVHVLNGVWLKERRWRAGA